MRRWTLLGPVLAGVLALTACSASTDRSDPARRAPDSAAASERADGPFTVATLAGGTFDSASLAGKPAVLWFWAPWCPRCASQAQYVRRTADEYAGKVTVLGVAGLDEVPAMRRFVDQTNLDELTHLADEKGVVWKRYGVTAQSSFVVLDASGAVVQRGEIHPAELDRTLARLVG